MSSEESYVIGAVGMVASLGLDAPTCCAAARAGLTRASALEHFRLKGPDGDVSGIAGHCAPILTHGFEGYGRLLRLAAGALADLRRDLGGVVPERGAFYISIPNPHRRFSGQTLLAEELRDDYRRAEREAGEAPPSIDVATALLRQATGLAGWDEDFELRYVDTTGHAGVVRAIAAAINDLATGRVDSAIVGGIDSLIGQGTLQWLNDTGRLKTPTVAAGLQPGEAGAFLMMARDRKKSGSGSAPVAAVKALQLANDEASLLSGEPARGDGLSRSLASVAVSDGWSDDTAPWILTDHNGELYRAYDWGHACSRLRSTYGRLAHGAVWQPAETFGDTGAASGAVSTVVAISSFGRQCAPTDSAVVLSASDGTERAAMLLRPLH